MAALSEQARAKVNLTLCVLGRRADGYHVIESLVVFADVADRLTLSSGGALNLTLRGPTAADAGDPARNLVLAAARALAARIDGLKLGSFRLDKRLPVAAGLGGGSADAAAALRLIARANRLQRDDPRFYAAARATGADVPVCLDQQPRLIGGVGEELSPPLKLPKLHAVLVNPGVALATADVFAAFDRHSTHRRPEVRAGEVRGSRRTMAPPSFEARLRRAPQDDGARYRAKLFALLEKESNDLEPAAISLQPAIADVLAQLRDLPGCRLARMSGSGATCFGLFGSARAAATAARNLRGRHRRWWVRACVLG